jgi:hypothetical protein
MRTAQAFQLSWRITQRARPDPSRAATASTSIVMTPSASVSPAECEARYAEQAAVA